MVKNELSKGIDIELGEEMAEGQYANMVVIAHSTSEFVLDFVRIMPGSRVGSCWLPNMPSGFCSRSTKTSPATKTRSARSRSPARLPTK